MNDDLPRAYYPLSVLDELREQRHLDNDDLDDLEARIAENEKHGLYTSPAVKELISELRELRSMRRADNEDIARAYDFARDKGQALERAAVVAWLRASRSQRWANAIERGEHRRKEER